MTTATVPCPRCQYREGSHDANFCSRCGGALRGPPCAQCDAPSEVGDRFCTRCGTAFGKAAGRGEARAGGLRGSPAWLAWAVTGVVALVLIIVLVVDENDGREITLSPPPASSGTTLGPTDAVPLSSMTPREAANRLFTRVMGAVESGDRAQADMFLPMAIAAYDLIPALSLDDRFHLSLLHAAGSDGVSALAVAEAGLAIRPTHLLCLAAAAEGADLIGDEAGAAGYYQTLLDVYDDEIAAGLQEYGTGEYGHATLLPVLREEALAYLSSSTASGERP